MRLNCREVAEKCGISYIVASGVVARCVEIRRARLVHKEFHGSGKGKPASVYDFDAAVESLLNTLAVQSQVAETAKTDAGRSGHGPIPGVVLVLGPVL